jgi:hypothetical protein
MTELQLLAHQVLVMLNAQMDYFKKSSPEQLHHCKVLERKIRKRCEEIVAPQPSLFPEEE